MKVTRFLLSVLFLGAFAATASAQTAAINWDTCIGPINKQILPGTQARAVVSATGHSVGHKAYQAFVSLGSGPAGLADAWRFDAAGCQGSSFITIEHLPPAALAKTCPAMQGANSSIQIKDYSYDPLTGKARAVLANTYPAGVLAPNPATRYFLAGFLFDHLFSVNGPTTPGADCGGLERAVCAHLIRTSWLDMDGNEFQYALSSEYVTSNDPNNDVRCPGATPAVDATWGSIKHQYKR
jgi:hypothetical protein